MSDERIITNAMIREQDQKRIAQLERDLAAAQAEQDELATEAANATARVAIMQIERDEARADLAAAQTRADAMLRVAEKWEAEAAALRVDAERGKWMIDHAEWWRDGNETRMVIRVADKADLSCYAMRELAIDAARGDGNG